MARQAIENNNTVGIAMNVNWIKGDIEPPESGEYYAITEVINSGDDIELPKICLPKGFIDIDRDYYDKKTKSWNGLGRKNPYWKILAWANILYPDIPDDLQGKVNLYFGVVPR